LTKRVFSAKMRCSFKWGQRDDAMLSDLNAVRSFIRQESGVLDKDSRYVAELLYVVDRAKDVADLERLLAKESRGAYWAGPGTFGRMTIEEKIRANLITNETTLMRFDGPEIDFLRKEVVPFLRDRLVPARVLSVPCSHGEEAVSLAIECLEGGCSDFVIDGIDIQPACIETARSGIIPLSGLPKYVQGYVDPAVMTHLRFRTGDAFKDPLGGPYDLIVCRNFLGYFRPRTVAVILKRLASAMAPRSYLLLDRFILGKHPEIFRDFDLVCHGELPVFGKGV
jgi:2-polyprenyl-3-methyl-5-hydroxy-6-metoxy-1,4-benzoquinol methylase